MFFYWFHQTSNPLFDFVSGEKAEKTVEKLQNEIVSCFYLYVRQNGRKPHYYSLLFCILSNLRSGSRGGEKSKEESLKVIYAVYSVAHSSPTQCFQPHFHSIFFSGVNQSDWKVLWSWMDAGNHILWSRKSLNIF